MIKRNFLVFINPVSGTKNKSLVRVLVEKTLADYKFRFEILATDPSGEYPFLKQKLISEKITDVIICGGDGTVSQVCRHLQETDVNAGIIPMGSGNGLALAAGIPKDPQKALSIIIKGKSAFIDAFMINDTFSCMLCGLGFDAQVAHDFADQATRGLMSYIRQTVKNFFSAVPYPFEIKANGAVIHSDAFFISIANSNQFGNQFTIAPKASLSDGLLDIVIVNKTGKLNLILKVLHQIRKGKLKKESDPQKAVHYFQTASLQIENIGRAPLHIDGEPAKTAESFDIKIIEKAFRLLQPIID